MPLPTIPEYSTSIEVQSLVLPEVLKGGHPIAKGTRLIKYSGGFCVVFPYDVAGKRYAVRCWHAEVENAKVRTQRIAEALEASHLPYFVGFEYFQNGIVTPQSVQPIVVMDWVDAKPLKCFIAEHIHDKAVLLKLADNFKQMVSDLHREHFSHGDLQHGNIMVNADCSLVLVDYDSMYVPSLNGMSDDVKGLPGYQHPLRWKQQKLSEKTDYFSEWVIYISLRALALDSSLWKDLKMEDTDTMVFDGDDFSEGRSAKIFSRLLKNNELSPLVEELLSFLKAKSLDELQALEDGLIPMYERISEKWKSGNGYEPPKAYTEDVSAISSKWSGGNGYNKNMDEKEKLQNVANIIKEKMKKQ